MTHILATEQTRMEAQAETVRAKHILEEEALKEKAAQIRAKEQSDQQNLVDLTLAQGKDISRQIRIGLTLVSDN